MLMRLMNRRRMSVDGLSAEYGISQSELRSVLDGGVPKREILDRLAAAFSWHPEDIYVTASLPLPDDMAPVDPAAGKLIYTLVDEAMRLSLTGRGELRQFARSLPQRPRAGNHPVAAPEWRQFPPGFGAIMVRFLENRNLDWLPAVYVLHRVTRLYLSAVTIGSIGRGSKELTPDELAEFSIVLGITAGDLAALAGIELSAELEPPNPEAAQIPELIWAVRRLTAAQVQQVIDMARSIRME
jgi:DNA-binding Xre family transcriptional regulator